MQEAQEKKLLTLTMSMRSVDLPDKRTCFYFRSLLHLLLIATSLLIHLVTQTSVLRLKMERSTRMTVDSRENVTRHCPPHQQRFPDSALDRRQNVTVLAVNEQHPPVKTQSDPMRQLSGFPTTELFTQLVIELLSCSVNIFIKQN